MSQKQRETLRATIYNLGGTGDSDLFSALATLTDEELEEALNDLLKK